VIGHTPPRRLARAAQRGMVLLMALIVLVVIMVAGIAMMRSVDTSTLVAGNLAFQQSATYAADKGIEAAMAMLKDKKANGKLGDPDAQSGYSPTFGGMVPASGTSWQKFWDDNFAGIAVDIGNGSPDQFGNSVYYVVQRQCRLTGPSASASCLQSPPKATGSSSSGSTSSTNAGPIVSGCGGSDCDSSNTNQIQPGSQIYYRITVRVAGPRRTESYVQTNIAM